MSFPIEKFMTPTVHSIRSGASVAEARVAMEEHGVRHLPVLDGGQLVGMVSARDLAIVSGIRGLNADALPVEEAMSNDVLAVTPEEPLAQVAARMAERRAGSAVVVRGERVLGIFTTTDALRALSTLAR
ncbi:MAG TPA: CBS domain-containing protein [Myxococcaceae bacterium]|nr:CBS domain-containing protein [Myxococcaceae bacterium]